LGSEDKALAASHRLGESGYRVTAIRPPTVPVGTSRLRITLSTAHSVAQVDGLLAALDQVMGDDAIVAGASVHESVPGVFA
ncbi:MAG: hypothetical protein EB102_09135, partial [Gammaproteobacteria bacterium]|nr:hypothetical protein [Gammaproteobacteria bacterium]